MPSHYVASPSTFCQLIASLAVRSSSSSRVALPAAPASPRRRRARSIRSAGRARSRIATPRRLGRPRSAGAPIRDDTVGRPVISCSSAVCEPVNRAPSPPRSRPAMMDCPASPPGPLPAPLPRPGPRPAAVGSSSGHGGRPAVERRGGGGDRAGRAWHGDAEVYRWLGGCEGVRLSGRVTASWTESGPSCGSDSTLVRFY